MKLFLSLIKTNLIPAGTAATLLSYSSLAWSFIAPETSVRLRTNESTTVTEISTQIKQEITPNIDTDIVVTTPLQIDIKGHLPIVLIPVKEGITEVKINPPSYKEAIQSYGQKEMSLILSGLMIEVQAIQKLIQKRQLDKAMEKVGQLQTQYPELPFLNFIKGSILFLQGKKGEARDSVKKAMEDHPDYEEGKNFLKNLGEDPKTGGKSE